MRDDIEFNVAFCRLVERHPALYNYMRPDYCNRSVQDKIWRKIGKDLNEKGEVMFGLQLFVYDMFEVR